MAKKKDLKKDLKKKYSDIKKKTVKKTKKASKSAKKTTKNLTHRRRITKDKKARVRAERLAKLPKSRLRRIAYYLHPKRFFAFWFSKRGLILGAKLFGVFVGVMIIVTLALFAYYRREIPDPASLQASVLEQTTKFYDSTGERVIYNVHGDTDRTWVGLEDISDRVEQATIAIEDKDFYSHGGFSITGVMRAFVNNLTKSSDENFSGGSTITQQFVKNAFLTTEQTYTRKIKELILALEMERLFTKDEILEFYLNQIPYGGTEYGIEAAAQSFFGKSAAELELDETTLLAALPQAPGLLSPYGENTDLLIARRDAVVDAMYDLGYISADFARKTKEKDTLKKIIPLEEKNQFANLVAPHYVVEVQNQLEELFGEQLVLNGGLRVTTTLDYDVQKEANKAVRENMTHVENPRNGRGSGGDNAALVAVDVETGQVKALVGSRDYNYPEYGAFNAAMADRQPGSSFKVYDYSALFYNERWGPDSIIYDTKAEFGNYKPQNFDFGYRGRLKVRQALGESRNIPAVKAMHIAGVENTLDLARAMGVKSLGENEQFLGLSAALGAGEVKLAEHTQAYSTIARGGEYLPQAYILKVENSAGEVLYEWEKPEGEQALDPEVAYLMTNVLTDDAARSGTFGLGNPRLTVSGLTHAVKTGTTNKSIDGWMMGFTKYYAVGVWAGNHDNTPMNTTTSWQTGPIFTQFLREVHKDLPNVPILEEPEGIQRITLDSDTGYSATSKSKNKHTGLFPSWHVKQEPPKGGVAYTIDTVSGNVATECTPEAAKQEVKASSLWPEILPDDIFFGNWSKSAGYSASTEAPTATDDVHSCNDTLPQITNMNAVDKGGGTYTLEITVTKGTHALDTLDIYQDGTRVKEIDVSSGSGTYNFTRTYPIGSGEIVLRAVVTDEVLYQDDAQVEIDVGTFTLSAVGNTNFSWTPAIPSTTSYQVCWTPVSPAGPQECETVFPPSTSHFEFLNIGTDYQAFVTAIKSGNDITSPTINFTP